MPKNLTFIMKLTNSLKYIMTKTHSDRCPKQPYIYKEPEFVIAKLPIKKSLSQMVSFVKYIKYLKKKF